jgi:23S rRNA (cytosine1962-C5)-methyltransferase
MKNGKVILKPKREHSVEHRHPWIFSGAIDRIENPPAPGETVEILSHRGTLLGFGSWSPTSQIQVRMLEFGGRRIPDSTYVKELVHASINRRATAGGGSPLKAEKAGTRLVHGESDGLPGVVVDCYDGWCVTQFSSAGAEYWKDAVAEALTEAGAKGVYDRSDVDSRKREDLEEHRGNLAGAEAPDAIEIIENGMHFLVDVRNGHKTGFYLDQREARALVRRHAADRHALNCFSYTGGFGLACALGGAKSVINLDLSQPALDLAKKNFALTFPAGTPCEAEFECADVFKQLRLYRDQGRKFGLIVLDPPKFADTKSQLMRAARGYKDINLLAMKLLEPGGILATFSCSGAMSTDFFDTICREAAFDAKRPFQIISRTRQADDHPVSLDFPEGLYLKGTVLRAM